MEVKHQHLDFATGLSGRHAQFNRKSDILWTTNQIIPGPLVSRPLCKDKLVSSSLHRIMMMVNFKLKKKNVVAPNNHVAALASQARIEASRLF